MSSPVWAQGFDSIEIVNPLNPQPFYSNTIAIPVKKAILTHNITHNQYVYALERFMQSNIKSSYNDFKLLIETIEDSDYAYMQLAEKMADLGFFNLSSLAASKISDKDISEFLIDDIKVYYYPSKKLKVEDEIYLGEVFSNIAYNDQSLEATSELVKNTSLLEESDYANYLVSFGYLKSNDMINANIYIDNAIKMNPQNLNYKKLKAEILSQSKKVKQALKLVEYIKAQNLYSTNFTRKVNSLEHYVLYKSQKNYSEKMYHLGYYYYFENESAKAVKTLLSAVSNKKNVNKNVYGLLARVYYDIQDFDKAQDMALKTIKIEKNHPAALIVLGDLSYREKDYKAALNYYRKAQNQIKNSSVALIKIAQTYEKLNKIKNALQIYEKVLKTYNDCYVAYYKIGLFDKSKENAYLKKSIAINPNYKDAWIDLGRIAIERQNYKDAKKYLNIANYIDENDFRYYYYQGVLAKKQGQDSAYYFKKSLSLNPDYEPAKEELKI